jgi:uncharacterized protein (DUF2235 family)
MKRLILCCDGTWNTADQQKDGEACPSNVVRLAYRIAKRDGDIPQITFYDQGVGTGNWVDRISGGAFGNGLEDNIHDAYRFLIANYEVGDEIHLFGFSRGAFTARSIGGMIRKCGILRRDHIDQYVQALTMYRSDVIHPDDETAFKFRSDFSENPADIPIKFIGVWDTVGSLGIPLRGLRSLTRSKHQFHDTELSGTVEFAYQALAIDEHRAPFEPTLWLNKPKAGQTVEQTWFCGAHSDVGGGYPECELADITLGWMIEKAQTHLRFDERAMDSFRLEPDPQGVIHNSKTGLYRVTAGIDRTIGVDKSNKIDATQNVHPTVLKRWDANKEYRPDSLRAFLKLTGDSRASQP